LGPAFLGLGQDAVAPQSVKVLLIGNAGLPGTPAMRHFPPANLAALQEVFGDSEVLSHAQKRI